VTNGNRAEKSHIKSRLARPIQNRTLFHWRRVFSFPGEHFSTEDEFSLFLVIFEQNQRSLPSFVVMNTTKTTIKTTTEKQNSNINSNNNINNL
jgi:hypothetical protein